MTNEELTEIVAGSDDMKKVEAYTELANQVIDYLGKYPWMQTWATDRDDLVQDLVLMAFQKEKRFNPDKGKAFNFFVTCMSGLCHCLGRTSRHYSELKLKYKNSLKEKQNDNERPDRPEG